MGEADMGGQDDTIRSLAGYGVRALAVLLVATAVSGCTPLYRNHGYVPSESELSQVVVGRDTRESVVTLIGAPTTSGVMNDDGFYYVQSRFRDYAYQARKEIDRQVLVISFDSSGVVSNIERWGLENGQVVSLSSRVTSDNVKDTTFIRQLLGNVGNFDAGNFLPQG